MPRRENRQNKTSRLQYQTVKNNQQPHIPAKTTGNTQGGGVSTTPAWTAGELSAGCAGFKHRWRAAARAVSSICR